jgi:hypothetical protein
LENKVNNTVFSTLHLAFADFVIKFIIEGNPRAGGGDQPIIYCLGREKIYERMES